MASATYGTSSSLKTGSAGNLGKKSWHAQGHAVVEVARTGRLHERHEHHVP